MRFLKRFLKGLPVHPRHKEERLKLGASGCQLVAIAVVGAAYIAPEFNHALGASPGITAAAALLAAMLEGVAMKLLRYIPVAPEAAAAKEPNNG